MSDRSRGVATITKTKVFTQVSTTLALAVLLVGVIFAAAIFVTTKNSNARGLLSRRENWTNICNNGHNYELTSNQQIYPGRIRKPTSYITPGGSIKLGLRSLTTGQSNFDFDYEYVSSKRQKVSINGSVASDIVTNYNDYDMFIDIYVPELSSCTNIKQPMRILVGDPFLGTNVAFIYPRNLIPAEVLPPDQNWATSSVGDVMDRFDVIKWADKVYQFQAKMFGHLAFDGDVMLMGLSPEWCGGSGQPTGFGIGCLIAPDNKPQWGVIFHEMGHNGDSIALQYDDGLGGLYSSNQEYFANMGHNYFEGIATLAALYAERMIAKSSLPGSSFLNISQNIGQKGIARQFSGDRQNYLNDLYNYESSGSNFNAMNPNIMDGIFIYLAENSEINGLGWEMYPKFFRIYNDPLPSFIEGQLTELEAHTYFIAGMSATLNRDLRYLFVDRWHFPIDDQYYEEIFPQLRDIMQQ